MLAQQLTCTASNRAFRLSVSIKPYAFSVRKYTSSMLTLTVTGGVCTEGRLCSKCGDFDLLPSNDLLSFARTGCFLGGKGVCTGGSTLLSETAFRSMPTTGEQEDLLGKEPTEMVHTLI
ncbi:hypothetical protein KC345_g206 [Hortaea werneckii]|nr:hypothetical protein KC345_g206 [Hortaea werneckii]